MDLKVEAQRVMAVALGKMYNSRLQRGGVRLHRSLLLSLVLRSARDIYLNVRAEQQQQAGVMEVELRPEEGQRGARPGASPAVAAPEESARGRPRECIHCGGDSVSGPGSGGLSVGPPPCPGQRPLGIVRSAGQEADRSRKRRKAWEEEEDRDSGCLPVKRARLENGECRRPAETSSVPGLVVGALGSGFSNILGNCPGEQPVSPGHIRRNRALSELNSWPRAIVAY
ncbi:immediate early response gene 2 protein-like [Stegostoma tigrinum]|uniref:immediate early response gene 2 protein-like n=1 Tax=Stegostoma tigrinum TaxID=3053191 RepID=UPI0028705BF4|nr:immediate early response gene 2 protein-like [Stegostoma tigrinum]